MESAPSFGTLSIKFEDLVETTHDAALEEQFGSDPQVQIEFRALGMSADLTGPPHHRLRGRVRLPGTHDVEAPSDRGRRRSVAELPRALRSN